MREFDVAVIGMGPGGEHVAGTLAERGLRVLGIERGLVGGECPYWGCVPTKMMIRAADALAEARRLAQLAGSAGEVRPDWSVVARRIREEATDSWDDSVAAERFTAKGGTLVRGTGRIAGPGRVEVDGTTYAVTRGIVVATGSRPAIPPIDGLSDVDFWTNHDAVEAEELPASLVVLGGGAIGCELAQVLARFGVEVTIVEGGDRLLAKEEPEASEALRQVFEREGIAVRTGARVARVLRDGTAAVVVVLEGGEELRAERLLVATGRRTDVGEVGLGAVGVDTSARAVPVDDRLRVAPGVWAVGDLTGKGAFTHVSMYQAGIVIRELLDEPGPAADYRALPRVTFTDPEIGAVGLTEAQAREAGLTVRTGTTATSSSSRGWIHGPGNEGLITLVADADRGVLVGATAMGPAGGEVLGALCVAVHAQVPIDSLRSMIYAYPTFHRGIEDALRDLG
ncbi:pyridine nucleotide-disulfide oxidoreductase [Flavimobilis marinus]|uniref:Pyruvate/2-oxoglutarate dehydrogenase complex, dihydrolipoamide dehydrogenase (E3) component n=1 Tax=Flavimobilis marinus TaxID=285351 RepID=A0A1I2FJX3_9MICO|nr:NAD(P)/FAD-dependent oxidoreductase [Flavimobilis marinus]GHG51804.1 pyridine nucleotide-disulfide oxidoreductase [Flavimobilis marinus]SFF05784.1 Pyruvate/2-oxoglutarate dehydrogenase complex, dihydrolipoamide dehydrogenase (E3) component [Flavimobilis marinus]